MVIGIVGSTIGLLGLSWLFPGRELNPISPLGFLAATIGAFVAAGPLSSGGLLFVRHEDDADRSSGWQRQYVLLPVRYASASPRGVAAAFSGQPRDVASRQPAVDATPLGASQSAAGTLAIRGVPPILFACQTKPHR